MELASSVIKQLIRAWWVVAFAILTFAFYEQSAGKLTRNIDKLKIHAAELEKATALAESAQIDLKLQVASQSDPTWIELSLIKGLGLVPEGYTKIYYEEIEAQ